MDVLNMWDALSDVFYMKSSGVESFKDVSGETVADYDEIIRRVKELRRGELDMLLSRLMNPEEYNVDWGALGGYTIPPFVAGMKSLLAENEKILSSATSLADLKGTDVFYIKTMEGAQPETLKAACSHNDRLMFVEPQDYSKTTNARNAFRECESLRAFESNGTLSALTDATSMFLGDSSLTQVTFHEGDLIELQSAWAMFGRAWSLRSISFPEGSLRKLTDARSFFSMDSSSTDTAPADSVSLSSVTFPEGALANVTNAYCMLYGTKLTSITFPEGALANVTDARWMLSQCTLLTSVTFPEGALANVTTSKSMARLCTSLSSVTFPEGALAKVEDASYMFDSCTSLSSVTFPEGALANVTNVERLFNAPDEHNSILLSVIFPDGALRLAKNCHSMFSCQASLEKIVNLRLDAATDVVHLLYDCVSLVDCELGGTLYKSGVDLRPCAKLSARSLYTWAAALYDWTSNPEGKTTDDTNHTLYLTDAQQTTLQDYTGDDGESGEDAYLTALDRGWTISA